LEHTEINAHLVNVTEKHIDFFHVCMVRSNVKIIQKVGMFSCENRWHAKESTAEKSAGLKLNKIEINCNIP